MYYPLALKLSKPWHQKNVLLADVTIVVMGSLLVAAMAQITIPLPFSPVPITGQTFGVLLVGMALGSRRGMLSMLFYLFEGGIGLPFFAGARGGFGVIAGPTGGYLIGFVLAAWVIGLLAERGLDRKFFSTMLIFLIGNLIIYLVGVLWLSNYIGINQAIQVGVLPFLIGDTIKALLAGAAMPTAWHFVSKLGKE